MTHRWQRKRVTPSHTEDWLMTYADVITLLLCFFAITIITSMPKREIKPETPKAAVPVEIVLDKPATPPTPTTTPVMPTPFSILPGDLPFHDSETDDTPDETPQPVAAPQEQPQPAPQQVVAAPPAPEPVAAPPAALTEIAANSQGQAKLEQKGDRITTMELSSAAFFGKGSATLNADGDDILRKLANELKDDKYKGYQITVEGHTDDTPIHTAQFPSNWELSTGRAAAVVRFFLEQGIPADSLRAAGYADTFPKAPNRDANGRAIPANQAENRRVVIKLEKIDKGQ